MLMAPCVCLCLLAPYHVRVRAREHASADPEHAEMETETVDSAGTPPPSIQPAIYPQSLHNHQSVCEDEDAWTIDHMMRAPTLQLTTACTAVNSHQPPSCQLPAQSAVGSRRRSRSSRAAQVRPSPRGSVRARRAALPPAPRRCAPADPSGAGCGPAPRPAAGTRYTAPPSRPL